MSQEYYCKLAERLWLMVEQKELGEKTTRTLNQYAFMLTEDVLDEKDKYIVSILAEDILSKVRDIPDKSTSSTSNRR